MAKTRLRKMLCDIHSGECIDLMRLIETQSKKTLASWAITYAEEHYLEIYEAEFPEDVRLRNVLDICREYPEGKTKLAEVKPFLKEAQQIARDVEANPVAQAAARAIAVACASLQTPANALGFLFYGAAAVSYSRAGLTQPPEVYDEMALEEFRKAYASLQETSVADEPSPVKINWNC